ncbi:MAG TPA: hypothetical protein VNE41_07750 [Chitinophagaceae bacterium]|nr:hypothetical protein [Chitinophagaceae bacterium]
MIRKILLSAVFLFAFGSAVLAQGVAGDWTATMHGQNGNDFTLNFHFVTAGDSLTGNVVSPMGGDPLQITNGRVIADSLYFDIEYNGNTIHHLGMVSGDYINLKSVRPGGEGMTMTLKRSAVQK